MTLAILRKIQRWCCPYCGKSMPTSYEPSQWSCCGEVGHAIEDNEDNEE